MEKTTDDTKGTKGAYLLLIHLCHAIEITIGQLGAFPFRTGWYTYAGSALGPGGLQTRLARHARTQKKLHWHIDYLLEHGRLVKSWQVACPTRLECEWASALWQLPNAQIAVHRFGASDCRCPGHLIYWSNRPEDCQIEDALRAAAPKHCALRQTPHAQ